MLRGVGRLWTIIAVVLVVAAGCGPPAPRELTPREALDRAADEADKINTAHFSLEQQNGTVQVATGIQIANAEGDIQKPDRLQMNFTLRLAGFAAEAQLIAIGSVNGICNSYQGAVLDASVQTFSEIFLVAAGVCVLALVPALLLRVPARQ
jgi:hypothetical protein